MFSFSKRKKVVEAAPKMRKLIDMTSPNLSLGRNEVRHTRRYNRCIPAIISDWDEKKGPDMKDIGFGFITDISDSGLCLLGKYCPKTKDSVIGVYIEQADMPEPFFFHAQFRGYRKEPLDYLRLGFSVEEYLNENYGNLLVDFHNQMVDLLAVRKEAAAEA